MKENLVNRLMIWIICGLPLFSQDMARGEDAYVVGRKSINGSGLLMIKQRPITAEEFTKENNKQIQIVRGINQEYNKRTNSLRGINQVGELGEFIEFGKPQITNFFRVYCEYINQKPGGESNVLWEIYPNNFLESRIGWNYIPKGRDSYKYFELLDFDYNKEKGAFIIVYNSYSSCIADCVTCPPYPGASRAQSEIYQIEDVDVAACKINNGSNSPTLTLTLTDKKVRTFEMIGHKWIEK
jgi:hypothetical protein